MRGLRLAGVLAAVGTLVAPAATAGAAGPRRLTVMTFNIAHAGLAPGGLSRVAAVIRSGHPDVVGLQEVDRSWSRSRGVDQAAELGRMLGMGSRFSATLDCASSDLDGDGICQYGTAILSRFPIVAGSERRYRLPVRVGEEPRALARLTIDVGGRMVDVFNTHLSFREPSRVREVAVVRRLLRADRRPFVLTGDLNALPFAAELVDLRRVARDAALAAGRPGLRTTALAHPVRLDYVMLPRAPLDGPARTMRVLSARVVYGARVSDHRPLVAGLLVPPGG
ncbi:MAG TPA: endonuclease/exonuclease/phosphatase family protein [Solirubrobacteraceae bacterium]|nr:endonuclease/exonuclease/phosphatase family protein [Solirubrobacteraceae bacterium]